MLLNMMSSMGQGMPQNQKQSTRAAFSCPIKMNEVMVGKWGDLWEQWVEDLFNFSRSKAWSSRFYLYSCFSALVVLLPLQSGSWGFFGHRHINYHAVFLLPPAMISFYKKNIRYLADHAVDPDKRRYAIAEEAPRHYIDMDHYLQGTKDSLPRKWDDAVLRFSADTLNAHGIAPWWIMIMQARLKKAFQECNAEAILKISADLGHYIADVHVPLHASSNHNGQKTDQLGIHGFWESRLPELYAEKQYDFIIGPAAYLTRPLHFIWDRVYESAAAADTVLTVEKKISQAYPMDFRFAYESRNGMVLRQYAAQYAGIYHRKLNGMVERRMRDAIYGVASFWFTAWVDAGQPDLSQLRSSLN
jgi:hypothetical protein